jgi:hypothetical protein
MHPLAFHNVEPERLIFLLLPWLAIVGTKEDKRGEKKKDNTYRLVLEYLMYDIQHII